MKSTKEKQFEELVRQYKRTIYSVCYMFSRDNEEVNDLFQEILVRLWLGYDQFENRSILAYGRIAGPGEIQDPYYDGSWTQKFDSEDELPAIGTVVVLRGTWHDGVIEQCTVTPTKEY